jgi:hypothetical protein
MFGVGGVSLDVCIVAVAQRNAKKREHAREYSIQLIFILTSPCQLSKWLEWKRVYVATNTHTRRTSHLAIEGPNLI